MAIEEEYIKNALRRAYRDGRDNDASAIKDYVLACRKLSKEHEESVRELKQMREKYCKYPSMKKP